MEIRHLRSFVCIARYGSFSKAAEMLHIAQPALSQQIRQMEDELGVSLFIRHARGVRLSQAGEAMLEGAEDILTRFASLRSRLQSQAVAISGEVRLGLPTTVVKLLGRMIARKAETNFPGIRLQIVEGMSGFLCDWLGKDELDLAILYDPSFYPAYPHGMMSKPILRETFRLILPPDHAVPPVATHLKDLSHLSFVFPRKLHAIRTLIDSFLKKEGVSLNISGEVDSLFTLVEMVRHGHATILPGVAVASELEDGLLRAHDLVPAPARQLNLVWAENHENARATAAIATIVVETAREMISEGRWAAEAV